MYGSHGEPLQMQHAWQRCARDGIGTLVHGLASKLECSRGAYVNNNCKARNNEKWLSAHLLLVFFGCTSRLPKLLAKLELA